MRKISVMIAVFVVFRAGLAGPLFEENSTLAFRPPASFIGSVFTSGLSPDMSCLLCRNSRLMEARVLAHVLYIAGDPVIGPFAHRI